MPEDEKLITIIAPVPIKLHTEVKVYAAQHQALVPDVVTMALEEFFTKRRNNK